MLIEYYFKIKHTKGKDNIEVDALSRMPGLQDNKDVIKAMLKLEQDGLIRYNHL